MQQSVIYQEWREEFLQEGLQKGYQEGRREERQALVFRQLARRIGEVPPEARLAIQSLPLVQLKSLGEVLSDFLDPNNLQEWLTASRPE